MNIYLRKARTIALLSVVALLTACASATDKAAQQAEVKAELDADKAFIAQDYKTAFADYQPMAENGNILAEARMAYMYHEGAGVAKDEDQARHWYEQAATNGSNQAAVDLGYDNMLPESGAPDYKQAMKWFTLAVDRGDVYANLGLSIIYEHGLGVPQDHDEALHWLNLYVAKQNVPGGPIHFKISKFSGGDNTGGFMRAVLWVLVQAAHRSPDMHRFNSGEVILAFHYQDGRATNVTVAKSSGNPAADTAATDLLQKTLLPPVLASLSHMENFNIGLDFESSSTTYLTGPEYH